MTPALQPDERAVTGKMVEAFCRAYFSPWKPASLAIAMAVRAKVRAALEAALALRPAASSPPDGAVSEALATFAKLSFSFDGFSLEPATLMFRGRDIGLVPIAKDHDDLQRAIDAARAARVRAAQGPGAEAQPVAWEWIDGDGYTLGVRDDEPGERARAHGITARPVTPPTDIEAVRREAREAERERCARVCEGLARPGSLPTSTEWKIGKFDAAAAIRALTDEASR